MTLNHRRTRPVPPKPGAIVIPSPSVMLRSFTMSAQSLFNISFSFGGPLGGISDG
ncbi:hypothetical protein EI94DRAFT_1731936 [Lactarius quietus]|nr:hypothetical protein EI94DRAFT_1731936 [Lactarius quietus]